MSPLRGVTVGVEVELVTEVCIQCGGVFALPRDLVTELRRNHAQFFCPAGHSQYYPGKTPEEQLREELEAVKRREMRVRAELDQAYAQSNELAKDKRKLEREKRAAARRTTNGACTMCHRHFADVERHMRSKHADQVVGANS